MTAQWSLCTR